jgi:succinyl-diaminopimelate desuccinylase
MSKTVALAISLLGRSSVTPDDAGCQEILMDRLNAVGFECETMRFGKVTNLWARRRGTTPGKLFVFAGHTDVVASGPEKQWSSPPFVPTLREDKLFARGAADMKAAIAAFAVACEEFIELQVEHRYDIGLVLTSDEEGDATDGTVKVVEELERRGQHIEYCVVGEPTSVDRLGDVVKHGRRGSLSGHLVVAGVQGHVAYPHLASNPIHSLAPALAQLIAEQWDSGDEHFPPTTFQVSNISAGSGTTNLIPGYMKLLFNLRFSPCSTVEQLQARVEAILARHDLQYDIEWTVGALPFIKPKGRLADVLANSICRQTGFAPSLSTSGGTSDARFLARIANEVVEFGLPGGSAHHIDEHVRIGDIEILKEIYRDVLEQLVR